MGKLDWRSVVLDRARWQSCGKSPVGRPRGVPGQSRVPPQSPGGGQAPLCRKATTETPMRTAAPMTGANTPIGGAVTPSSWSRDRR